MSMASWYIPLVDLTLVTRFQSWGGVCIDCLSVYTSTWNLATSLYLLPIKTSSRHCNLSNHWIKTCIKLIFVQANVFFQTHSWFIGTPRSKTSPSQGLCLIFMPRSSVQVFCHLKHFPMLHDQSLDLLTHQRHHQDQIKSSTKSEPCYCYNLAVSWYSNESVTTLTNLVEEGIFEDNSGEEV